MKTLLSFVLLFFTTISNAQEAPVLKAGKKQVGLSSLDISVEIVGNKATTTFDMLYYNPTNQLLEGELSFPLGEGFNVSRFALDVNGKLREAVVVDKELGRIAFEAVVRRRVDPALLEKGTGNNYKARIYPIPANGYKRVVLAYEQELLHKKDGFYFELPLHFKNKLKNFKLHMTVFEQEDQPIIQKGRISGLQFNNWQRNFTTKVEKQDYIPNESLLIKIPTKVDATKIMLQDDYLYTHLILDPTKKIRNKATEISLYWDASLSMKDRDLTKELDVLQTYFSYLENVKVHLITFSNAVQQQKTFHIRSGNWNDLKRTLQNTVYDGGTNYQISNKAHETSDLILLFSDGIQSLKTVHYDSKVPLITVNSLTKSNHAALSLMAEASKGTYINLTTRSVSEAFAALKYEPYQFLGYTTNNKTAEFYPKSPVNVQNTFSIAAKGVSRGDSVILHFGHGSTVEQSIVINAKDGQTNVTNVPRMWAQKKLAWLQQNSKENKAAIVKLATAYSLVTDHTSLIVLEEVMDYVRYQIEPPAELLDEYRKIIANMELHKKRIENGTMIITEDIEEAEVVSFSEVRSQRMQKVMAPEPIRISEDFIDSEIMVDEIEITEEEDIEEVPFAIIEQSPIFPGCESEPTKSAQKQCFSKKIQQHVTDNFNIAVINELNLPQGTQRVFAMFSIDEEGKVGDIRIRAPHERISRETKRMLMLLPEMIPGKQRGMNVSVRYTLPIIFRVHADGTIHTNTAPPAEQPQAQTIRQTTHRDRYTYRGALKVTDQKVTTPYIKELEQYTTVYDAYDFYLLQREKHEGIPAYYVDVANFFNTRFEATKHADRILSNIAETDFDNYELLKVYGYQLQKTNQHELALFIFKRVLELRTEDAQSYRDVALAYQNVGEYQKALDLFERIVTGEIYKNSHRRSFAGMRTIVSNEIDQLVTHHGKLLNTKKLDKTTLASEPFDVRIVVDWNHNDTDIDLYVIDPNLEECSYKHTKTKIGGHISRDMTQGFGPEEFTLKNAIKGDYYVKIHYFGDRYQKIENPTFMKVTLYKYYGTTQESKEVKVIRLSKARDQQIVAKLHF